MSKKDMILALIEHYSNGNKAQFANLLGISPQGLSTWIKRDTFDIELIFSKCEGLSAHWLLTGEGEMLNSAESYTKAETPPTAPHSLDEPREELKMDEPKPSSALQDPAVVRLLDELAAQRKMTDMILEQNNHLIALFEKEMDRLGIVDDIHTGEMDRPAIVDDTVHTGEYIFKIDDSQFLKSKKEEFVADVIHNDD